MWSDFVGKPFSRGELKDYVSKLNWTAWRPTGIVLHNTAAPTLAQWAESGDRLAARIRNLQHYYEQERGWGAGPHFFVGRTSIVAFSNPLRRGVHSPSFNSTHLGIEMAGDYDREEFNSGDGALVRDNAVFLMALLCKKFGWEPDEVIKLHREDPRTTHACPGRKVVKADVINLVEQELDRLDGPELPEDLQPVPVVFVEPIPTSPENRLKMARQIYDAEVRLDSKGNPGVYKLPANDGGGRYEVAGLNERYDKVVVDKLVKLIGAKKYAEAKAMAIEAIAENTDPVVAWHDSDAVESYLRDTMFNRGLRGATRILQRAVGVPDDGILGPISKAAIARVPPAELLLKLRAARESYERNVVGYRANFWKGLTNRWNKALKTAQGFPMMSVRMEGKLDIVLSKLDGVRDDNRATCTDQWVIGLGLAILIVVAVITVLWSTPALALPAASLQPQSLIEQVQYRGGPGGLSRGGPGPGFQGGPGPGFRHGGRGYGGHHGGYGRRGYDVGVGGLIGGMIVGGAIAAQQYQTRSYEEAAIAECARRFRSYDVYTRSYLGYDGFRHPCPR